VLIIIFIQAIVFVQMIKMHLTGSQHLRTDYSVQKITPPEPVGLARDAVERGNAGTAQALVT
jgi:hypothetical protein